MIFVFPEGREPRIDRIPGKAFVVLRSEQDRDVIRLRDVIESTSSRIRLAPDAAWGKTIDGLTSAALARCRSAYAGRRCVKSVG